MFSSLCALVIGILLVIWPGVAINYLVVTVGVLFFLPGLIGIFSYIVMAGRHKEAGVGVLFPVVTAGSTLLGVWLIVMPGFFVTILMYVLGVLLLLGGLSQFSGLAASRHYMHVPAVMYVFPVLVIVAGIVVLFNPFEAAMVPFVVLGCSFIVYSLSDIFRLIRYRRKDKSDGKDIQDITPIEETKE